MHKGIINQGTPTSCNAEDEDVLDKLAATFSHATLKQSWDPGLAM